MYALKTALALFSHAGPADWALYSLVAVFCIHCYLIPRVSKTSETDSVTVVQTRPQVLSAKPHDPTLAALEEALDSENVRNALALLRALGLAGVLTSEHCSTAVMRFAKEGDLVGVKGAVMLTLKNGWAIESSVLSAVLIALCENGGESTALELYKFVTSDCPNDYFFDLPVLERLIRAAGKQRQLADVDKIFEHAMRIGRPSVGAYALAIHAAGNRGALITCMNLYDDLQENLQEYKMNNDISPAWNSLVAAYTRNGRNTRAISLYKMRGGVSLSPAVVCALNTVAPDDVRLPRHLYPHVQGRVRDVRPTWGSSARGPLKKKAMWT